MTTPVIMVHGGAWKIPEKLVQASRAGTNAASRAGYAVLMRGGSAIDAVHAAIHVLEDDPSFDAGTGSVLTKHGEVEMDFVIMNGKTLASSAVSCVQNMKNTKNPIDLARAVMEKTPHILLVGKGANEFADEVGIQRVKTESLVSEEARRELECYQANYGSAVQELFCQRASHHDTVGAVAMDAKGNLAYATSTGGISGKKPGRVGDRPIIGAGGYADNDVGAVSCKGHGESISKVLLAHQIVSDMRNGKAPQEAADTALAKMAARVNGYGGVIVLSNSGEPVTSFTTDHMPWAWIKDGVLHSGFNPDEDITEAVTTPVIMVHGGVWKILEKCVQASKAGTHAASRAEYAVLMRERSAIDAVHEAIHVLEDDPSFDAGAGGYADNDVGAVSCTRHGESISKVVLAHQIVSDMRNGESVRFSASEYEMSTFPACETALETVRMIDKKCESVDVTLNVQESELIKENSIQIYEVLIASSNTNTDTFSINEVVERISRLNKPAFIIGTIEKRKSILDYCRTHKCVFYLLIIDDNGPSDDAEIPSNVKVAYSTTEHKMAVADDLLERFAFRILRNLTERLLNTKHANDVDAIIEIIRCAFKRSEVPESEWPKLPPKRNDPENIDRVIEKVLAEDGVLGCTKRNGRLIIYMKDTLHSSYDKVKQTVTQILFEHEIKDYQIHHGSYQPLYKPGDGILNESGTLGGFAKKIPKHNHENNNGNAASNLVALVSRHVVIDAEMLGKMSLYIGDKKVGEAIIHPIENLDIVPVDIFPEFVEDCQTEYISHDGKTMNAHTPDSEFWETSMGKFVCLWGQNSNSKPAVGYIQEPMFKYGSNPTVFTILIREHDKQPVSEAGDSGSIVCALSRKRDKLYALAMIMGRWKHSVTGYDGPCYIALRLEEAFSMLEGQYSATFKLCNEHDTK